MNMFEEATALSTMMKMTDMTQSEMARKLGVSQSYVANKIRLLRLPEEVKREILAASLCERQARGLLRLSDKENMLRAIEKMKARKMTVAESDAAIDMLVETEAPRLLTRREIRDRLYSFESFIDRSVESLISFGIKAEKKAETYGEKRYITIALSEK